MGLPAQASLKREQRAWFVYDWANSAYFSTVVTLFLGPYLTAIAKAAAGPDGYIHPFGLHIDPRSLWGYLVSLSVLTQVLVLPLVGAIADYGHRKREMLGALAYTGAIATMCLFFVEGTNYLLGAALFLVANLAFGASMVVYNAFLPEISTPEERDSVSSKGWGIGYLGGGLLLALNLAFLSNATALGITKGMAVRISMGSAGLWCALFTLVPMAGLRNRGAQHALPHGSSIFKVGFQQFSHTVRNLRRYPKTLLFLLAYLTYNDAIQTVIAMAGQFGSDDLKMPMEQLTLAILMVQFVAFAGAMLFNWLSIKISAKRAVLVALVIWTGVLFYIYLAVSTPAEFFIMAALVGIVMGGSQALSRSLFSLMIPEGKEAEYFSLYEISDKGTSWLGPLVFGLALQMTGSYRLAALSLAVFFVIGFVLLSRVNIEEAAAEAHSNVG
ncbi:MAG: MFS transporter [Bryobacterales bacterium]|nr:MFS transporter [Bryobacterales bacterium]